jgi:threonyl-tRNA synthetase
VKIISVGSAHIDYCQKLADELKEENVRVEVDDNNETVGNKIRKAVKEKTPYMLVIGDKEINSSRLIVRDRGSDQTREISQADFIKEIKDKIKNRS